MRTAQVSTSCNCSVGMLHRHVFDELQVLPVSEFLGVKKVHLSDMVDPSLYVYIYIHMGVVLNSLFPKWPISRGKNPFVKLSRNHRRA